MLVRVVLGGLIILAGSSGAAGQGGRGDVASRWPGESDAAFAARVLQVPADDLHTVTASWNGAPTIFADYVSGRQTDTPERPLVALRREPGGRYRKLRVTVGETEGGEPDVAAIGFANADRDPARELIVILAWNQPHDGACGPVYEVRIFDDPEPGDTALRPLPVSKRFGEGCAHFRFTTVAAVKRELARLGY